MRGKVTRTAHLDPGGLDDIAVNSGLVVVGLPGRQCLASASRLGVSYTPGHEVLRESGRDRQGGGEGTVGGQGQAEEGTNLLEVPFAVQDAMDAALQQAERLPELLAGHPRIQVLALYLSPWEAFLDACADHGMAAAGQVPAWTQAWINFHEAVLKARLLAPGRVFLINAGRMNDPDVVRSELCALGADLTDAEPAVESVPESPLDPVLLRLVASQMADAGREYWSLYEALESCAVLAGREPEFRGTADLVDTSNFSSILASLGQLQHAAVAGDSGMNTTSGDDSQENQDSEEACAAQSARDELHHVQLENELLNLQLHELYVELDYHVASNTQLRNMVIEAGEAADSARCLIARLCGDKQDSAAQ